MTYSELLIDIKNRIDEVDEDEQIDKIIIPAINYAYHLICTTVCKKDKTISFDLSKKINKLPNDFKSLITAISDDRELTQLEYDIKGNLFIRRSGEIKKPIEVYYVAKPSPIPTSGEIDLSYGDVYPIIVYSCYVFYSTKKRVELAMMLLQEFNNYLIANGVAIETNIQQGGN